MIRRITLEKARIASRVYIAKDPEKDFDKKIGKLKKLMLKYGFKDRFKQIKDDENQLIFCDLTIFGEMANIVVERNQSGFGSKKPLTISIYIPEYNGGCGNWEDYFESINKINNFIEDVKKIDGLFLQ